MKLFRRDQKFDVTSHFITSKSKFLNVENFMSRGTITYIHETEINRCSMRVYMQKSSLICRAKNVINMYTSCQIAKNLSY